MAELATIASIATIGAAVVGTGAAIYAGSQSRDAAYVTARNEESRGRAEFAAATREAEQRHLENKLIESRQQAIAAASGGGAAADAPTIIKLLTETRKRGDYAVGATLYGGESTRQAYYDSAAARRRGGDNTFLGSILTGVGTLAGGFGDWAEAGA